MRGVPYVIAGTVAAAVGGYLLAAAQGWIGPDYRHPLQAAMILKQTIAVEAPLIKPLPPEPNHLRVLVTYLNGDEDGAVSHRLYDALRREPLFETILIYRPGSGRTAELAKKWKADVVVSGRRHQGTLALAITSPATPPPAELVPYRFDAIALNVPEASIEAQNATIAAAILASPDAYLTEGRFAIDALVAAVKELDAARMPNRDWAARVLARSGYLSSIIADVKDEPVWLRKAVAADRAVLQSWTRASLPRAAVEANLGLALTALGERENNALLLLEAASASREALKGMSRATAPHDWAMVQQSLGEALYALSKREGDVFVLDESVDAFRLALTVQSTETPRLKWWAPTQSDLGLALFEQGKRKGDLATLEQSVEVLNDVLKVQTRENSPSNWAKTEETVGIALAELGKQKGDTALLRQGADAFRRALTVINRSREPLTWSRLQLNLGMALAALGGMENSPSALGQAVSAYRDALSGLSARNTPDLWADTQSNLGVALVDLYNQKHDGVLLNQAVDAFQGALAVYRERGRVVEVKRTEDNIAALRRVQTGAKT